MTIPLPACLLLVALAALPAVEPGAAPPPAPVEQALALRLDGALLKRIDDDDTRVPCAVDLDLAWRDGVPTGVVWGYGHAYNRADHRGTVTATAGADGRLSLAIALTVAGDGWVGGAEASYAVELVPAAGGAVGSAGWTGTYTGTCAGHAVRGAATATVRARWLRVPEQPVLAPHPRLAFRREDIPALRAFVRDHAVGRDVARVIAQWAAVDDGKGTYSMGAAQAVQHVLSGDPVWAERCLATTRANIAGNAAQDEIWSYAQKLIEVALCYDLCHDAWDAAARREVRAWLRRWAAYVMRPEALRPQDVSPIMTSLSQYSSEIMFRASGALAALAVLGDGAEDPPPTPDPVIAEPAGMAVGRGVPVVAFEHDRVLTDWLSCEGLREDPAWRPWLPELDRDPLAAIGGCAAARPEVGTEVVYRDSFAGFKPLDRKRIYRDAYSDGRPAIDLLRGVHYLGQTLDCYYLVLRNDRPRRVALYLGDHYLRMDRIWISGHEVRPGQAVRLQPGDHPLLIRFRLPKQQTYSPYFPAFFGRNDYKSTGKLQERGRRANWRYNFVKIDDEAVPQLPRADLWCSPRLVELAAPAPPDGEAEAAHALAIGMRSVARYVDRTIGDRGWGSEDECDGDAQQVMNAFLASWRVATGLDPVAGTPLEDLFATLSIRREWTYEFYRGMAAASLCAPPRWRPLARWQLERPHTNGWFLKTFGIGDMVHGIHHSVNTPFALAAMAALCAGPQAVPARDPAAAGVPLTWIDERSGGAVFAAGHGSQDPLVVVRGAALVPHTAAIAGTFAIAGFDRWWTRTWVPGEGVIEIPTPGRDNTLQVEGTLPVAGARLLEARTAPDGSGRVVLDCARAFFGADPQEAWLPAAATGVYASRRAGSLGYGVDWGGRRPQDVGVRARRTVAVDHSGRSGAPLLVAVCDHLAGSAEREKTWTVWLRTRDVEIVAGEREVTAVARPVARRGRGEAPPPPAADQANLRLVLIEPADAAFTVEPREGRVTVVTRGERIVVLATLQHGPAPAVTTAVTPNGTVSRIGGSVVAIGAEAMTIDTAAP